MDVRLALKAWDAKDAPVAAVMVGSANSIVWSVRARRCLRVLRLITNQHEFGRNQDGKGTHVANRELTYTTQNKLDSEND